MLVLLLYTCKSTDCNLLEKYGINSSLINTVASSYSFQSILTENLIKSQLYQNLSPNLPVNWTGIWTRGYFFMEEVTSESQDTLIN